MTAAGSRCHSPGRTSTHGSTGRPCAAKSSFMNTLSVPTAEDSTPAPTYRTPASSSRPCKVPSWPHGPCITGNTTSTSPRLVGTSAGVVDHQVGSSHRPTGAARPRGHRGPRAARRQARGASRSGSADSSTQRPSGVIPIGTTSYFSRVERTDHAARRTRRRWRARSSARRRRRRCAVRRGRPDPDPNPARTHARTTRSLLLIHPADPTGGSPHLGHGLRSGHAPRHSRRPCRPPAARTRPAAQRADHDGLDVRRRR